MAEIQAAAQEFLPQMRHCTRCRADAVGLLDADRTEELRDCLSACAAALPPLALDRPYVAVGSREGMLVNLHLGEAASFQIWAPDGKGFRLLEERPAPPAGGGEHRWRALAEMLHDCRAVLVSAIGDTPRAILTEAGAAPLEMTGLIEMGLRAVYEGQGAAFFKARRGGLAKGCTGKGLGSGCG
jgi:nitrogen fixation protein NifB